MSNRNYYDALLSVKEDSSSADEWLPASASRRPSKSASKDTSRRPVPKTGSKHVQSPLERSSTAENSGAKQAEPSSNGLHLEFPALRLEDAHDNAKENMDGSAASVRVKTEEDVGLQQPTEGRSGLYKPLFWVDLEMTGLDPYHDTIIEIACLITDGNLQETLEGPDIAIHHPDSVLGEMNSWCIEHHGESGLTERCRKSTVSMEEAEAQVLAFVSEHIQPGAARLAGNSVHVDAAFLRRLMPRLHAHLHHRIVDVSTVAELCTRWYPQDAKMMPRKKALHTAMADIKQSVEQLRYYRVAVFKPTGRHRRHL
ncbi:g5254 [Coccomyxa viridis]|uniref:G5254 protein n=1 Tax=Coccomyxa viridis TaxID=1274662 RepID=A0ABP1FUY0_9CHLO